MSRVEVFLKNLYKYLVDSEDTDNNIVRTHSRDLQTLGEFSFPVDINNWRHLLTAPTPQGIGTVFEYASANSNSTITPETLMEESRSWPFVIVRHVRKDNFLHLFLERASVYKTVIDQVLRRKKHYGSFALNASIVIESDPLPATKTDCDLTQLRLFLLREVTENFLRFNSSYENQILPTTSVLLTSKSSRRGESNHVVVCEAVLDLQRKKDKITVSEDLYSERAVEMQLVAEHNHGLRMSSLPDRTAFFATLGSAAVTVDLLQNKIGHSVSINRYGLYKRISSSILYNCARLSTLLTEFDKRVKNSMYPPLPPLESIDFSVLNKYEEWGLLFSYILQFPQVVKSCIGNILDSKINIHYLIQALSAMSKLFSGYYQSTRILRNPHEDVFGMMHARIYLLKAYQQVLHNGLHLLSIEPVHQM